MQELDTQCQGIHLSLITEWIPVDASVGLVDKLEVESKHYLKKRRTEKDQSVTDDRALQKLREEFQKAVEFGDEKVNLAVQTYELVR